MNFVKFYTCLKQQLDFKEIENGALYIVTDSQEIYADVADSRVKLSSSKIDWEDIKNKPTGIDEEVVISDTEPDHGRIWVKI